MFCFVFIIIAPCNSVTVLSSVKSYESLLFLDAWGEEAIVGKKEGEESDR